MPLVVLALPSSSQDPITMGSKVSVRESKKPAVKKAKSGGVGVYVDSDDSITLIDMIRTVRKPTQQQRRRRSKIAAKEEEQMVNATADLSSGSDDDLGKVCKHYKRKRKCKDLYDILKRGPSVIGLPGDRQDGKMEGCEAKKLESSSEKKGHDVKAEGDGKRKVSPESFLPSVPLSPEQVVGSPVCHQNGDKRKMMDTLISFPNSMAFGKPVVVTDGSYASIRGFVKPQRPRTSALRRSPSPYLKTAGELSASQSQVFETSDAESDLLPVSGSGLHTCPDPKNCQNACVAKAVAPNLDHMSEEELIYWYEEVTRTTFTSRTGEKVRGRIRRVIRAEVKRASALNNSNMAASDESVGCDPSTLGPRTPSPGKLVINICPPDSRASEFSALADAKEDLSCAFNSAASFDECIEEEITRTSSSFRKMRSGSLQVPQSKDDGSNTEEVDLPKQLEPLESTVAEDELSVMETVDAQSVPIDFVLDVNHAPGTFGIVETDCGDFPPSSETGTLTVTEERCGDVVNVHLSHEGRSVLALADSAPTDTASLGIVSPHSLPVELRGSLLNAAAVEESEIISHQPAVISINDSTECALNSGAAKPSQIAVGIEGIFSILLECELGGDEEKATKTCLGSSSFAPAGEIGLCAPEFRPAPPSRELGSPGFQYGEPLRACSMGASTRPADPDCSSHTCPSGALEAVDELEPTSKDEAVLIMGCGSGTVSVSKLDEKREDPVAEDSSQFEREGATGKLAADGPIDFLRTLEVADGMEMNSDDKALSIKGCRDFTVPILEHDEEREQLLAQHSSLFERPDATGEIPAASLNDSQQTAAVLSDLQDRVTEPSAGVSADFDTSQRVSVCISSESQQFVDGLNDHLHVDTPGDSTHVELSVQDGSQLSCVDVIEFNTAPAEVCDTAVEDESHQRGNSYAVPDASNLESFCQSVNDVDGCAETCCSAEAVKGLSREGLPTCRRSPLLIEASRDKMGACDAENVSLLHLSQPDNAADDRVPTLEEYIAVHQGENAASPQELVGDLEEYDEPRQQHLLGLEDVSLETREGGAGQGLVDEFATQQMPMDAVCRQPAAGDNYRVEEVLGLNGADLEEGAGVHKMEDRGVSHHTPRKTTNEFDEEMVEDIASEPLPDDVALQVVKDDEAQKEAESEIAPPTLESGTPHALEEDGAAQPEEKEILAYHNAEDGTTYDWDEAAVSLEDLEDGIGAMRMENRGHQANGDTQAAEVDLLDPEDDAFHKGMDQGESQQSDADERATEVDYVFATQEIVELVLASDQPPKKVAVTRRDTEDDIPLLESEMSLTNVEKAGASQHIEDGTAMELKDESSSHQLDATQGEIFSYPARECVAENEADLNVTSQAGELCLSHLEQDTSVRQTEDAVVQSLEEDVAPDRSVEIGGSCLPSQLPKEVVSSQVVASAGISTDKMDADDAVENAEGGVGMHQIDRVGEDAHLEQDISVRQTEDAVVQSLEEDVAPDRSAEIGGSCLPSLLPKEVVSSQVVASAGISTFKMDADDAVENAEGDVGMHQIDRVGEDACDALAVPVDHGNAATEANDDSEEAVEDALDYPVTLSQPRRPRTQEECTQDALDGVQGSPQATSSISRRMTRAFSKLEKNIRVVEEQLVGSIKLSSPRSQGPESVVPDFPLNCSNDFDPPGGERNESAVLEQALPPAVRVPLLSDSEFEQFDTFPYASLQDEWQDAGKVLDHIAISFFEEGAVVSSPRKRKLHDPENDSDRVKRVAVDALLQDNVPFGTVQDTSSQRVPEETSMEDDHVPTALSKAIIEKNGERRGARYSLPGSADQECPSMGQRSNAKEKDEMVIPSRKRKVLLEESPKYTKCHKFNPSPHCLAQSSEPLLDGQQACTDGRRPSPESNVDPATIVESNASVDLLASEKPGDEESSQDCDAPSKLPCRRKTISPLSQLELMRASSSNSPPTNEPSNQKIPSFRLKLPVGISSHLEGSSPLHREPNPGYSSSEPNIESGKRDTCNGTVVSLDSSEDDTEVSCGRQGNGLTGLGGDEPERKFSLCLSPTSPSPESVRTDSSQTSSQEARDSQFISAPSSKGILKTGPQACKGLCKCAACSTSRSKAGTAADFIASQMKTFQQIAGRLTKEMQGLRAVIETNLSSPGEIEKMQESLKKSREAEEAADKNLASLLRDCKRYSKLTATKPLPMRKIVFADEAGKKLCHVKTFESRSLPKSILDLL